MKRSFSRASRVVVLSFCLGVMAATGAGAATVGTTTTATTTNARTVTAPATQPLPDVQACVSRLDPQVDVGYDRIAGRCPEIGRLLQQGPWSPWLPKGWQESGNDLSAGGLSELRELVRRESVAATSTRGPDVRHLQRTLARLGLGTGKAGWWTRFKAWLRSALETREQPDEEGWFSRMVSHVGLSQSVLEVAVYAALAVVVALAAFIVANELRLAGLLPGRGSVFRQHRKATLGADSPRSWGDIERAPLGDRPRLLLELLLNRLSLRGYLPPAGSLTVRELTSAARLPDENDCGRLFDLAMTTERMRFSDQQTSAQNLERTVERGRELLERLDESVDRI